MVYETNITHVLNTFEEYEVDKDVVKYLFLIDPMFTGITTSYDRNIY